MPVLTSPALVAACLLVVAGAQKVIDPTMTVGALRGLRLPSSAAVVRAGSAVELVLGVAAITLGGRVLWLAVGLSYLVFAGFVSMALRAGTMIGSCGCFGRDDTPPHWTHIVLNLGLAATALTVSVHSPGAPIDAVTTHPGDGGPVVLLSGLALYLLHAAFVHLPRALAAGRAVSR